MEEVVIQAKKRDVIGKQVKVLRQQGYLPGVLYGRNVDSIPVSLDYRTISKTMPYITSSQLLVIDLEGEKHYALVQDKQLDPVQSTLLHVDFLVVSMTEKLHANVTIELIGEATAVKELSGVLVSGQETIEVECLPKYLPERISVDISVLKEIGDSLYVKDIDLPPEIDVLTDQEEMVVTVTYQVAEVEEEVEELVEELEEEPEVIERGKKEDESPEEESTEES
ncbi:MAG: 50S ribosomal protein L25 [Anaerolineales bacterium]|nr:50S ribosomal protein L25 [Anaerolineales bacterium]